MCRLNLFSTTIALHGVINFLKFMSHLSLGAIWKVKKFEETDQVSYNLSSCLLDLEHFVS